jgi:hypothetical protein
MTVKMGPLGPSMSDGLRPLGAPITGGGKKGAPPPPDYMAITREQGEIAQRLLEQQTRANRPNQSTPFASSNWTQDANGNWTQNVGLNGPLGDANQRAQALAAQMMGQPLDLGSLPGLTTGEEARQHAIDAAYGQATSRLDPQWSQMEDQNRTRLLNQGLAEGSEAYNRAMERLGGQRNDAYNQAMFSAIGQGTSAGNALFNQSMASRQNALAEMLQQRSMPMQDLQQLQGLTAMPGFQGAGRAETPNLVGAASAGDAASMQRYLMQQQQLMDAISAFTQLAGTGAMLASDERMKQNIERLPYEVLPGVQLATWEWRPEFAGAGPTVGVVAQDLQQVAPYLVHEAEDGHLMVDYGGLGEYL